MPGCKNIRLLSVVSMIALCGIVGCFGGSSRLPVSGKVSLDGKPLPAGSIQFTPVAGTAAPSAGGEIIDGKFFLSGENGLPPGKYAVQITAFKKTGKTIDDPQMGAIDEQIRVEFNETALDVEVRQDAKNEFDLSLTEAGPK